VQVGLNSPHVMTSGQSAFSLNSVMILRNRGSQAVQVGITLILCMRNFVVSYSLNLRGWAQHAASSGGVWRVSHCIAASDIQNKLVVRQTDILIAMSVMHTWIKTPRARQTLAAYKPPQAKSLKEISHIHGVVKISFTLHSFCLSCLLKCIS
jgi:hypothetical protein